MHVLGVLVALVLGLVAAPAAASAPACRALAPAGAPLAPAAVAALPYACGPMTAEFRDRWLWTRLTPPDTSREYNLIVRPTRVDRVRVVAVYADGTSATDEIRAGDYGNHWSMDNRVTFDLPERDSPLRTVYVGADHLRFSGTLAPQLIDSATARLTSSVASLAIGASIALLAASFIYNCFRLFAQRQTVLIGHVLWAAIMLLWALLWSQAILVVFPGLAGTWTARLGTLASTGAIAAAAGLFAAAIEPVYLGRTMRRGILGLGLLPVVLSVATTLELGSLTRLMTPIINFSAIMPVIVVSIAAVIVALRGSRVAREFLVAWVIPMAAVFASSAADISIIPGTSGQMSVLIASALQTILLSMTMTMNVAEIRAERDRARAQGAEYRQLALTDTLTALSNRRGFVTIVERLIADGENPGLIILDLDHFKSINDNFGHLAGDEALARVGRVLAELCPAGGGAGRLGGEEFGLVLPSIGAAALMSKAERVRSAVAAIDMGEMLGGQRLACSVGVADFAVADRPNFDGLFSAADRALYDAKRHGRDRVVVARRTPRAVGA